MYKGEILTKAQKRIKYNARYAKVINCDDTDYYWYYDKIGEIYEVIGEPEDLKYGLFQVLDDKTHPPYFYILKKDVEILSKTLVRELKIKRVLNKN